jgi:aminopeptidase N
MICGRPTATADRSPYNLPVRSASIAIVAAALLAGVSAAAAWWIPRHVVTDDTSRLFDTGVSQALARDRAGRVTALRYDVHLDIPAIASEPINGRLVATFELDDASRPLAFDFAQPVDHLRHLDVNDETVEPDLLHGHVVIPQRRLRVGRNIVAFDFTAGNEPLNRHDDFLYSLFVPARASLAMPVFDQPDLKARWRLSLDMPKAWVAVSNGRQSGRVDRGDRTSLIFDETRPIPTYLFAFAAGRFSMETAERNGRTFRMFHRETDAAKLARNRDAIFDLHAQAVAWMETYTGVAYPFEKFDFVVIPAFQFSGMEHPGAVFYNASSVLLDASATQSQQLTRAIVIAHETAHAWFGDLVTMRWFDDVWMKEVFANFFADRIVEPSFPGMNHALRFFLQHAPSAYDVDRTDGTNPIRQTLDNLSDAGSLYGAIIYDKAPIVIRQLELLVGADAFRDGLREYLTSYAFGNASWPELITLLDRRTPLDLAAWSRAWVSAAGRPRIETRVESADSAIARLTLRQSDPRGRSLLWPQRLSVDAGTRVGVEHWDVTLTGAETVVPNAAGRTAPEWILPSGGGLGYGDFVLDTGSLEALTRDAPAIADPLTRGAAFVTLWESMLDGRVAPSRLRDLLMDALPRERDELLLQLLLDRTRTLFWRFTPAEQRLALASRLEPLLRSGLDRATSTSEKAAWFNAIRSVAMTPGAFAWLERVWRRDESVPGLPLAETDESDLAIELAIRNVPDADAILRAQLNRIANPDRHARFAFLMPAASTDPAVRARFFDSLRDARNRTHEAWVIDAMRVLHHPLRASTSAALVQPALALIREIQRTGDIFFPKRWTDATLSGYQSADAAAAVRQFIDTLPRDYPQRLRWVLLSSADPLFRAAQMLP